MISGQIMALTGAISLGLSTQPATSADFHAIWLSGNQVMRRPPPRIGSRDTPPKLPTFFLH
jgi:hypothetical protein